jgi:hypothetical protein
MANTARASKYNGAGIEWLRGEERYERVISSPRPAHAHICPTAEGGATTGLYELSGSGG